MSLPLHGTAIFTFLLHTSLTIFFLLSGCATHQSPREAHEEGSGHWEEAGGEAGAAHLQRHARVGEQFFHRACQGVCMGIILVVKKSFTKACQGG